MAGANVPKLRFPEFSGEWEEKKFGELGDFYGGGTPDTKVDEYWNGEIPWISSSDLFEDSITNISITRHISKLAVKESATKLIPSNSILIVSRVGVGKFAVSNFELATSQDFTNFTPCKDNPKFLAYWLSFDKKSLLNLCQGTSIKGFTTVDLKSLTVKIPLMPEQTKIAEFLGVVDEKIKALRQKHGLLKDYKRSTMQKIFTQQIRFKKDDGTTFPDWEEKKLGEVASINPKTEALPHEFNYIDLESVVSGKLLGSKLITREEAPSRAQRLLSRKDILFQMVRPYQRNNLFFDEEGVFVASTGYAQIKSYANSMYLYQNLHEEGFVAEVIEKCTGTNYPVINSKDLAEIVVKIPHPEEQQKIADFLSSIDNKIDATQSQINQMTQFKKGLLQQMFV